MTSVKITPWPGEHSPTEREIEQQLGRENLSGYSWSNAPHDRYAPHSHPYNKVIYVLSGSITWLLPESGGELTTRAGDRLDLPRGVVHGALVGDAGVVCIEAHRT